jgi:hypothetical protein
MSVKQPVKAPRPPVYEAWDEDRTQFRHTLRLDAATYMPDRLFDIAPVQPHEVSTGEAVISPSECFAYQNRILPAGKPLNLYGKQHGIVVWNGDVVIPGLIDLTRWRDTGDHFSDHTSLSLRMQAGAIWMSLTPMEMMTQRSGVKLASRTVVIGGLGLGWLLRKVCEKPEVEQVIVVEKSQEVLDWYGFRMCSRFGKVSEVICDDVYRHIGKHGVAARYLLDIWHLYSGAADDHRLVPFRRKINKRRLWAWGLD